MIAKFYCSKRLNKKTNEFEFHFKEAKKKEIIFFKTLDDAIAHLKSLKIDATMWVRENEVFVCGVKVRVGDNVEEEVKVEIIKFEPKPKKEEQKPVTKKVVETPKKEDEQKISFDDQECVECQLLEENSKEWMDNVEILGSSEEDCEECATLELKEDDKLVNEINSSNNTQETIVECEECKKLELEENVVIPNNGCVECANESSKSPEIDGQKFIDCKECADIEAEIAKWDEEIMSSSLEQEGNIFLLEAAEKQQKPIVITKQEEIVVKEEVKPISTPISKVIETKDSKEYEHFIRIVTKHDIIVDNANQYVLLNEETNEKRRINVIELKDFNLNEIEIDNRRESIWTITNYILWGLFWFFLVAFIIILIIIFGFGGYINR